MGVKRKEDIMQIKMKQLPESERPYEKMEFYGAEKLSNSELLAIIIKCGTKEETSVSLAQKVLKLGQSSNKNDLTFLQDLTIEELTKIKGIGKVKAIQILATCELAKRISKPVDSLKTVIKDTKDVATLFMKEMQNEKREKAKLLILDSKNVVIKIIDIATRRYKFCIT